MPTEITVRGSFAESHPPQRATVHAVIAFEGPAMAPVYDGVARDLEAVKASIAPLHDPQAGPVTWWSAEQLRTWSERPWNNQGKRLPLVHHARVGVAVKFADFTALSRWVGEHVAGTEGFRVERVQWALTVTRRDELLGQARTRAVQDAVTRAQQYADALGFGAVRPAAIADAGMLAAGLHPESGSGGAPMRMMAVSAGAAPSVELVPDDIEVSAAVDARFVVGEP